MTVTPRSLRRPLGLGEGPKRTLRGGRLGTSRAPVGPSPKQSLPSGGSGPGLGPIPQDRAEEDWPSRAPHNHYSRLYRPRTLHTAPGSTQKCELGLSQSGPSWALGGGGLGAGAGESHIPECRGSPPSHLLPQMTLEASSPPLGRETKFLPRAATGGPPIWSLPRPEATHVNHLSPLVEQTGALGVLRFLIQWCQTLHLPSEAPRAPHSPPPLHEPAFWRLPHPGCLLPYIGLAWLRGKGVGEWMGGTGEGMLPWHRLRGFWGPGLGPRRKVFVCERVRECVCVCTRVCLPQDHHTLCMYACFCKKEKKEKKKI